MSQSSHQKTCPSQGMGCECLCWGPGGPALLSPWVALIGQAVGPVPMVAGTVWAAGLSPW